MKKILALAMAAMMALSLAACGGNEETPETTTEAIVENTEANVPEETVATDATEADTAISEENTDAVEETDAAEETTAAEDELDLNTTEGIVEFYKAAAIETDKGTFKAQDTMTLESLDGGNGAIGKFISLFEPIAKRALSNNSGDVNSVTGGYEKLSASDVSSAKAVDDGKYTTVTINLKEQVDGMSAPEKEGTVGHGITVLGEVQDAIDALDGVSVDPSGGAIKLRYSNAQINVKIDNATGKIVSGTWGYKVNITIDNVKASLSIFNITLDGAKGVVDYKITY